jgi:transcription initiation factor IIE alpha subunit
MLTLDRVRDDDLAYLMGMNTKELHKLCGKLKEDRFLAVYGCCSKPAYLAPAKIIV